MTRPGADVRMLIIEQILDLQSLILSEALMVLIISAVSDQDTILSARASLAKNLELWSFLFAIIKLLSFLTVLS